MLTKKGEDTEKDAIIVFGLNKQVVKVISWEEIVGARVSLERKQMHLDSEFLGLNYQRFIPVPSSNWHVNILSWSYK